jgi:hypothetical protein
MEPPLWRDVRVSVGLLGRRPRLLRRRHFSDANVEVHGEPYSYTYFHTNAERDANGFTNAKCNGNSNCYPDSNNHCDAYT